MPPENALGRSLAAGVLVLDGGLATELENRGHDLSGPLWSARVLAEDPDAVHDAHLAYFRAGARVATTASYQASIDGYVRAGLTRPAAEALITRSVTVAEQARRRHRDEHGGPGLIVAASVGPYGAVLADGSEYTGDYDLGVAGLRRFHRPRLELLASAGADVLAVETVPCLGEVEAVLAELQRLPGVTAWLSLSCAGGRTRRGEDPAEAYAMARDADAVVAVGVNCLAPGEVADLVPVAATAGKPVLVYPNSGEAWDAARRRWTGRGGIADEDVRAWVRAGAAAVGGCCRVGPDGIARVAALVQRGLSPPGPRR